MPPIMSNNLNSIVVFVTLASSALVLFSNYKRNVNRAIFLGILLVSAWVTLRQLSSTNPNEALWFRACVSIGPLILAQLIFCSELISYNRLIPKQLILRSTLLATLILSIMPWHSSFARNSSSGFENGAGFYIYIIVNPICYIITCLILTQRSRTLKGAAKTELQIITHPSIFLGASVCILMLARTIYSPPIPKESTHVLVAIFTLWLAYSFSTHKAFDTQHTFTLAARYAISITLSIIATTTIAAFLPHVLATGTIAAIAGALILIINHLLPRNLGIPVFSLPETNLHRNKIHEIIQTTSEEQTLTAQLLETIGSWGKSNTYIIPLQDQDDETNYPLCLHATACTYLQQIRWATPERLRRLAPSEGQTILLEFLTKNTLGAIVVSAGKSPTIITLNTRSSHKPFTYPEIQQLQEFASITELALIKARLTAQAIHADRLITIGILGASLAHEIRNPLYAIKAFAELLPLHYDREDFRHQFTGMVNVEAGRIDSLLSDMTNLSKPRKMCIAPTHLNAVVESSLDLVSHNARCHEIIVKRNIEARFDELDSDAAYVKQVVINLCINAINAQSNTPHPRWIQVSTTNINRGYEITVSDNGSGIAPHLRGKLFRRFQTGSPQGTGLGLCISKDLITNLGGTLEVDPPMPGKGATFRVVLPSPYEFEDAPETATSAV